MKSNLATLIVVTLGSLAVAAYPSAEPNTSPSEESPQNTKPIAVETRECLTGSCDACGALRRYVKSLPSRSY
ncbi:hypothetical protein F5Y15DRAFT_223785 [Xylariaceae sp. FL0016]|nr:hypothetical protein F5Y15DRAFT_223785 [Xylariaceae sp. FL0016]